MICQTNKKVLVCTPSNSAIDEIVLRLGNRVSKFQTDSQLRDKIVRVGAMEQASSDMSNEIRVHTLDYKVDKEIQRG
jgi:superfamily I DNA and/or RNA helicase